MDYKQRDTKKPYYRTKSMYEEFGNFNFGAVAYSLGLNEEYVKSAAGIAQIISFRKIKVEWLSSYFDDPSDAVQIHAGYVYARLLKTKKKYISPLKADAGTIWGGGTIPEGCSEGGDNVDPPPTPDVGGGGNTEGGVSTSGGGEGVSVVPGPAGSSDGGTAGLASMA